MRESAITTGSFGLTPCWPCAASAKTDEEHLRRTFGEEAHTGPQSLLGLLAAKGWKVHPDPGTGREQAGFTGGFIVRTYGSGKADGIDAIQLEFGIDYRRADARDKTAEALAAAVTEWSRKYLGLTPEPVETTP